MAAYMIIAVKMKDREKFVAGYGSAVADVVAKYGGEYLFVQPGVELLEGTRLEGYSSAAVSKWESKDAAKAFWYSDDYADVKKLREGLADCEVMLVEGA